MGTWKLDILAIDLDKSILHSWIDLDKLGEKCSVINKVILSAQFVVEYYEVVFFVWTVTEKGSIGVLRSKC